MFKASGLSKRYGKGPNSILALDNAKFSLPDKGVVGIRGKSGSGKSTLLMILATLCKPTSGRLYLGKSSLGSLKGGSLRAFRRDEIGIIYQHYNLFEDLSIEENVAYPLMLTGLKRQKAIAKARALLERLLDKKLFGKKPSACSGGERQRAAIARALINDPKVILADEPTGALDYANGQSVMGLLRELGQSRLIVIISHSAELDSYCDFMLEIAGGKLVKSIRETHRESAIAKKRGKANFGLLGESFKRCLKRDYRQLLSAFVCCLIGFTSVILGLAFFFGNGPSIDEARIKSADAGMVYATISKTVSIDDKQLSLVKNERPSFSTIENSISGLGNFAICNDYSFLFPESCRATVDGKEIECSFSPVYDFSYIEEYGLSYVGSIPGDGYLSYCVVNEAFVSQYELEAPLPAILLELKAGLSGPGWEHHFEMPLSMTPLAVIEEFSFMNSPRVYFSYKAFENELGTVYLEELSQLTGRSVSIKDLCSDADPDSPFSCYRYCVFAKDRQSLQPLFDISEQLSEEESPLQFTSRPFVSYESFASLSASLEMCMFLFGVIEVLLCACIAILSCFLSFRKHRRNSAIALSLGASNTLVVAGFSSASIIMVLLGCLASLPLSFILNSFVNIIIERIFKLESLLGFSSLRLGPAIPYLAVLGFAVILGVAVFLFSLLLSNRISLDAEMKDE